MSFSIVTLLSVHIVNTPGRKYMWRFLKLYLYSVKGPQIVFSPPPKHNIQVLENQRFVVEKKQTLQNTYSSFINLACDWDVRFIDYFLVLHFKHKVYRYMWIHISVYIYIYMKYTCIYRYNANISTYVWIYVYTCIYVYFMILSSWYWKHSYCNTTKIYFFLRTEKTLWSSCFCFFEKSYVYSKHTLERQLAHVGQYG